MSTDTRRVFFALWPDKQVVAQLADLQDRLPLTGKPVAPHNFHITLAFIGAAGADYLNCLTRAASAVEFKPFVLSLENLGYFRKPRIAWVGPSIIPPELNMLHARLLEHLAPCGYAAEPRPFRPHVTLARKSAPIAALPAKPVVWEVNDFALVESKPSDRGADYHVLDTCPLR